MIIGRIESLKALSAEKLTPKAIGAQIGYSEVYVRQLAKKHGIQFQHANRRKYWTNKEIATLKKASAAGKLDREIAATLNRTVASIEKKREALGIRKPYKLSFYEPQRIAQVIKFRMAGWSLQEIADVFGVTLSRISYILKRAGLTHQFDQRKNNFGIRRQTYQRWTPVETHILRRKLSKCASLDDIYACFPNRTRYSIQFKADRLTKHWRSEPTLQIPTAMPIYKPIASENFSEKLRSCDTLLRGGRTDIEIAERLNVSVEFVRRQRKFLLELPL